MDNGIAKEIIEVDLAEELVSGYAEYAFYTVASRAIPSVVDGMNPAERRLMWWMSEHGVKPGSQPVKSAKVTNSTAGDYHPHGEAYGSLVSLAAPYNSLPLTEAHGSFGTVYGDKAAASRYTEVTLSDAGVLALDGASEGALPLRPNYSDTLDEPVSFNPRFPNILVNGRQGIATAYSCLFAEHNPSEVMDLAIFMAKMKNPENVTFEQIREHLPGPDFGSGGTVIGVDGVRDYYMMGVGAVPVQGKAEIVRLQRGKSQIHITELPYQVSHEQYVEDLKKIIMKRPELDAIVNLKNLTSIEGLLIELTLRKGSNPEAVLSALYKYTNLQKNVNVRMVAYDRGGLTETQTVPSIMVRFLNNRRESIATKATLASEKLSKRSHVISGLITVLLDVDKAISIIRESKNQDVAKKSLMSHFSISDEQAQYILSMQLRRLTQSDSHELQREYDKIMKELHRLEQVLNDPAVAQRELLKELKDTASRLSHVPRKTRVLDVDPKKYVQKIEETVVASAEELKEVDVVFVPGLGVREAKAKETGVSSRDNELWLAESNGVVHKIDTLTVTKRASWDVNEDKVKVDANIMFSRGDSLALFTRDGSLKVVDTGTLPKTQPTSTIIPVALDSMWVDKVDVASGKKYGLFILDNGKVLKVDVSSVKPKGVSAGVIAGVNMGDATVVRAFMASDEDKLVTVTNDSIKVTLVSDIPTKGRGAGGVQTHAFRKADSSIEEAFLVGSTLTSHSVSPELLVEIPEVTPRGKTGSRLSEPALI